MTSITAYACDLVTILQNIRIAIRKRGVPVPERTPLPISQYAEKIMLINQGDYAKRYLTAAECAVSISTPPINETYTITESILLGEETKSIFSPGCVFNNIFELGAITPVPRYEIDSVSENASIKNAIYESVSIDFNWEVVYYPMFLKDQIFNENVVINGIFASVSDAVAFSYG